MRRSSLLPHDAACITLSCPTIGQPDHLKSTSSSLASSLCQVCNCGIDKSISSGRKAFRRDSSTTCSHQFREFRGSSLRSHVPYRASLRLFQLGITDRNHGRLSICTTASTKEREWQEYDDAVHDKDLERGIEVLDVLNTFESDAANLPAAELVSSTTAPDFRDEILSRRTIGRPDALDNLKILDACQRNSDLMEVGRAYDWLESRGFLPNFGIFKASASEGERLVTEAVLMDSIGLEASKVSPKKWGLSGASAIALPIIIALYSYLLDSGVDLKALAALVLVLGFYDALYLGGTGRLQVFSMWLPYRRRVLIHEAGHILVAYLLGCPIRGVIFDPMQALKMGIQGQAGTQFWDESLKIKLSQDCLTGATVDRWFLIQASFYLEPPGNHIGLQFLRYSIVLFAGIAAEAMIYGEAQGGESDENLFKSVVLQLQPSWSPAKISNQARWAVLQAFKLIIENKKAHLAVVQALEQEAGLGSLIRVIEEALD